MRNHQPLHLAIGRAAPTGTGKEGPADLDRTGAGGGDGGLLQSLIARGADHCPARPIDHDERVTLRQRIVEGEIAPGAKLNERALSELLQVSRTPLREAIKMLAAEGLVALLPNRGAVAAQLSLQDVADTFEVIADLEG